VGLPIRRLRRPASWSCTLRGGGRCGQSAAQFRTGVLVGAGTDA